MELAVHLIPPAHPLPAVEVAVVVDVLRASSALAAAAAGGVGRVMLAASPEQALAARARAGDAVLGGERGGRPPEGFELGNSPLEYGPGRVAGRTLIFSSTNGARVARLASARRRLFGAFVNGAALARALHGVRRARLVCAGRDGRFAVEDAACAGWLVQRLLEAGLPLRLQPAVGAARALAPRDAAEIRARVWGADHARELRRMGMEFARDVEWCAQVDVCDAVAEGVPLEEGRRS